MSTQAMLAAQNPEGDGLDDYEWDPTPGVEPASDEEMGDAPSIPAEEAANPKGRPAPKTDAAPKDPANPTTPAKTAAPAAAPLFDTSKWATTQDVPFDDLLKAVNPRAREAVQAAFKLWEDAAMSKAAAHEDAIEIFNKQTQEVGTLVKSMKELVSRVQGGHPAKEALDSLLPMMDEIRKDYSDHLDAVGSAMYAVFMAKHGAEYNAAPQEVKDEAIRLLSLPNAEWSRLFRTGDYHEAAELTWNAAKPRKRWSPPSAAAPAKAAPVARAPGFRKPAAPAQKKVTPAVAPAARYPQPPAGKKPSSSSAFAKQSALQKVWEEVGDPD